MGPGYRVGSIAWTSWNVPGSPRTTRDIKDSSWQSWTFVSHSSIYQQCPAGHNELRLKSYTDKMCSHVQWHPPPSPLLWAMDPVCLSQQCKHDGSLEREPNHTPCVLNHKMPPTCSLTLKMQEITVPFHTNSDGTHSNFINHMIQQKIL